jgi:beta-lactamase superfamily II metal-dependent hydrolase
MRVFDFLDVCFKTGLESIFCGDVAVMLANRWPTSIGGFCLGVALFAIYPERYIVAGPTMTAHFINVGQGAATLLEFPCGAILIDTGAQDDAHEEHTAEYLADFFRGRADLRNTLAAVFITHPHVDHTRALQRITETCRVQRYIDGGILEGSGSRDVNWIRQQVESGALTTMIRQVSDDEVVALPRRTGLSDEHIDPIQCDECDPRIRVLSASLSRNPGWSDREFRNFNNHSLVIRVDFGESSFLFTGDMETVGTRLLVDYYRGTQLLDVDVYQVGHHGSYNGTSSELLRAMSPDVAVIGVGRWTYGRDGGQFTTFAFGHPRRVVVDLLTDNLRGSRSPAKRVMVFDGVRSPSRFVVRRPIYATGWDGDVRLRADWDGTMTVDALGLEPVTEATERELARPRFRQGRVAAEPYDSVVPEIGHRQFVADTESHECCRCGPRRCRFLLRRR